MARYDMRRALCLAVACIFVSLSGCGDPRPSESEDADYGATPILRLNASHHFSDITRAGITADGSVFATSSRDNTIRLWSVAGMQTIATIRPPISNDYETAPGSSDLRSVDISPDGRMVAAAGQARADGTSRVFVFDAASGDMIASPLTGVGYIADLAFSRDGALLAAGVASMDESKNGLWVWDTQNWQVIYHDDAYTGESERDRRINGIKFSRAGVLVTTSYDGRLRRYANVRAEDPGLTSVQVPDGLQAYDVEFSPDGNTILVGYIMQSGAMPTRLSLLNNDAQLTHLRDFDTSGLPTDSGVLTAATAVYGVSFSASGRYVFASLADPPGPGYGIVRRWPIQGNAPHVDVPPCSDYNVIQILPYSDDGAILVNAVDPCLSVIGNDGVRVEGLTRRNGRFRVSLRALPDQDEARPFLVSRRGDRIYLKGVENGFSFDLGQRLLQRNPVLTDEEQQALDGYVVSAGGLTVSQWADSSSPMINGAAIPIAAQVTGVTGRSFSVDVAPSGEFAVLGTSFFIQRFGLANDAQWPAPQRTPGLAMRTNITPDANVVVVAYTDGTVRWHDAADGRVLLSLLVDATADHWVLWTPSGYYDASPGSDDMIGWHLNHGRDQAASFVPASRYQDVFYRPDIVDAVVETIRLGGGRSAGEAMRVSQSDPAALARVRREAPPIAHIVNLRPVSDREGTGAIVTFGAESPSGKAIDSVRIRVDGRTYVEESLRLRPGQQLQRRVPVRAGDRFVTISAHSEDGWGSAAVRGVAQLVREAPQARSTVRRPTLHALVVGVEDYSGTSFRQLNWAVDDAESFSAFLEGQRDSQFFGRVSVTPLVQSDATADAIGRELSRLTNEQIVQPDDVVVIFLAGHGFTDVRGNYFYVPYGAQTNNNQVRRETTLQARTLANAIDDTPARVFVFMDTCYAYAAVHRGLARQLLNLQKDVYVFTSSTERQTSREDNAWRHGAFTRALLDGLHGQADTGPRDRFVSSEELGHYLQSRVRQLTSGSQQPQLFAQGPDGQTAETIDMFEVRR